MVAVAGENQHGRDNVMCEHLPMILSPFLDVDDQDLLKPKCVLHKNVPFSKAPYFSIRPVGPELCQVEPVVGIDKNILCSLAIASSSNSERLENVRLTIPNAQNTE